MAPPGGNWFSQPVVQKTLTQSSSGSKNTSLMGFDYVGLNEKGEGRFFVVILGFRKKAVSF